MAQSRNRSTVSDLFRKIEDVPSTPTIASVASVFGTTPTVAVTINYGASGGIPASYTVTSNPGSITATGAAIIGTSTTINVPGLTSGTSYTFTATATGGSNSTVSSASAASSSISAIAYPNYSGGTVSSDATYYYRTFTATSSLGIALTTGTFDYLVVSGGGSGVQGYQGNGGGGAGGVLNGTSTNTAVATYTVTVGAGGSAGTLATVGASGAASSIGSLAVGTGGGGGGGTSNPGNGGSGGGARGGSSTVGTGVSSQG